MPEYNTKSLNETLKLGKKIIPSFKTNVIGLIGELGSGKTAFVKGVADYFGIQNITSPTFTVMKVYKTKKNNTQIKSLIHVDCYRLDDYQSLLDIGLGDYLEEKPVLHSLSEGGSLVLIEWADKIKGSLSKKTKYIKFKLDKDENTRIIII